MILGFKQYFPWKEPTNFREKILAGVNDKITVTATQLFNPKTLESTPIELRQLIPKIHTFREDKHDRWKAGRSIQMVYRGPKYSIEDHFNKGIPELERCVSTQKIKIWITGSLGEMKNGQREQIIRAHAIIDGKRIDDTNQMIFNDGFSDVHQFARWFNKPWEGKIIHFTDFRY